MTYDHRITTNGTKFRVEFRRVESPLRAWQTSGVTYGTLADAEIAKRALEDTDGDWTPVEAEPPMFRREDAQEPV